MKRVLILAVILSGLLTTLPKAASAQFERAEIGVNGLTCSQCSRTVEMSLRKLDFVANIEMNLQHTEGKITFKKNSKPDMDKIAQAVIDAGFSVRYLKAELSNFGQDAEMVSKDCFDLDHNIYVFTETPGDYKGRIIALKFIGKKFLPKNEFRKMAQYMSQSCGNSASNGKVYHVQLVKY